LEAVVAETDRDEAQRRRADARRRRRGEDQGTPEPAVDAEPDSSSDDEPLDTVKHAAKVAAAAAAVGAAVGAARALSGDDEPQDESEDAGEPANTADDVDDELADEPPEPAAEQEQPQEHEEDTGADGEDESRRAAASPEEAGQVVATAREQLAALLGKEADSVSSLQRTEDGWRVTLEVVEVSRIPESTDVLASYEVELDGDRNLVSYRRGRRYYRSQADAGES
jgi:hypothetical protein